MEDLAKWSKLFGIYLSPTQLDQFRTYESLLLEWNERISLTAIREPREIRIRHFLDSLACVTATGNLTGRSLIDIGSGAGFPGLPLKILFPDLILTLVDSVAKKGRFLEIVVAELGLRNVSVLVERAEVLGQDPALRERFDWAVGRAVAELRVLVEYLLPLCRIGGHVLSQKGDSAIEEVEDAANASAMLGGGKPIISSIQLPDIVGTRYLIVIPKVNPTEGRYPRRAGIPAKRPL